MPCWNIPHAQAYNVVVTDVLDLRYRGILKQKTNNKEQLVMWSPKELSIVKKEM